MSKYSEYKDFKYCSADGKTEISAKVWEDEKVDPRAILQISHGMLEYKERYNRFARWMASRGILVCANDHLGHGDSVANHSEWGYMTEEHPSQVLIDDMHTLRSIIQKEYPELPYFIAGHSMGSYLLRAYLSEKSEGLSGVIILGTGAISRYVADFGIWLCGVIAAGKGWHFRSRLIEKLTFSGDYLKFDMTGSDFDNNWLNRDHEVLAKYYKDPKCTFKFTLSGYKGLFEAVASSDGKGNSRKIPADLPILLMSGDEDPVGGLGKGVKKVYRMLKNTGHTDVEMKLYEGARHEVLNDLCREDAYEYIRSWIMKRI